jgi:uncharacterized membrane protein
MEWLKANKWIVIAGLVVLVILFGGDSIGVPTFFEGQK